MNTCYFGRSRPLSMVTLQRAAAFVWSDHYTLCYSDEIPEDGPEQVHCIWVPLDNCSGNVPSTDRRRKQ